jgi:6-phosphogluconolactonase
LSQEQRTLIAYLGGYTSADRKGHGQGMEVYRVDQRSGDWTHVQTVPEINPTFFVVEPRQRYLYSINGASGNQVNAFVIEPGSGQLSLLNRQPSHGDNPVFPAVNPTSRWLVLANYAGATIAAYPLGQDGRTGEASDVVKHQGSLGPNRNRQDQSHPHQITWDPAGRFLFVPDLGEDRTYIYRLSPEGKFVPNDPPFAVSPPGSGPRHIAFASDGRHAFLIHEMGNLMTAFAYDSAQGVLAPVHSISTLPPDFGSPSTAAEVAVAPSGQFVYGSNRGHDSIVVYETDPGSGALTPIEWVSTQGGNPRHFALNPDGTRLYAENQDSDTTVEFAVDEASGRLTSTGRVREAGSPACLVFAQL